MTRWERIKIFFDDAEDWLWELPSFLGFLVFLMFFIALTLMILFIGSLFLDGDSVCGDLEPIREFSHFIWAGKTAVPVYETVGCVAS